MLVSAYLCIEKTLYLSWLEGTDIQLQEEVLVLFIRIRNVSVLLECLANIHTPALDVHQHRYRTVSVPV